MEKLTFIKRTIEWNKQWRCIVSCLLVLKFTEKNSTKWMQKRRVFFFHFSLNAILSNNRSTNKALTYCRWCFIHSQHVYTQCTLEFCLNRVSIVCIWSNSNNNRTINRWPAATNNLYLCLHFHFDSILWCMLFLLLNTLHQMIS